MKHWDPEFVKTVSAADVSAIIQHEKGHLIYALENGTITSKQYEVELERVDSLWSLKAAERWSGIAKYAVDICVNPALVDEA